MVLGWDFEYIDDNGNERYTATSGKMMNEVTYPVWMHKVIDGQDGRFDAGEINSLFVPNNGRDSSNCTPREDYSGKVPRNAAQADDAYAHSIPTNYDEVQPESSRGTHYSGSDPDAPMQTVVAQTPGVLSLIHI